MKTLFSRFVKDESGATAIEYGLIAAGISVYIAQRFGWQAAFILPGVISLGCAVAFALLVPAEEEAPAKRKPRMNDLPPSIMARIFAIMTFTAVTGSTAPGLVFQMIRARTNCDARSVAAGFRTAALTSTDCVWSSTCGEMKLIAVVAN